MTSQITWDSFLIYFNSLCKVYHIFTSQIKNLNIYTKKFQEDLFDVTFIRFIHTPGLTLQIES